MLRIVKMSAASKPISEGGRMSEERFANLETMVAFHEDTIQKLNDVIYEQQVKIDKLEEQVKALTKLIQTSDQPISDTAEE
jgi:uncharacterized coiled-coil protein SlyX